MDSNPELSPAGCFHVQVLYAHHSSGSLAMLQPTGENSSILVLQGPHKSFCLQPLLHVSFLILKSCIYYKYFTSLEARETGDRCKQRKKEANQCLPKGLQQLGQCQEPGGTPGPPYREHNPSVLCYHLLAPKAGSQMKAQFDLMYH